MGLFRSENMVRFQGDYLVTNFTNSINYIYY